MREPATSPGGEHEPRQVVDVDLLEGIASIAAEQPCRRTVNGEPLVAGAADVLVRVHGTPVARVRLDVRDPADDAGFLEAVRALAGNEIAAHLSTDAMREGPGEPDGVTGAYRCSAWQPLPDPAPRVTVVVPTVGRDSLGPCLDSLLRVDYPDYEVVIADNSQSAEQRDLLEKVLGGRADGEHRLSRVREPRPGTSFARNRGLAGATGDIVAFVDDDVLVDRRWMRALVAGFGTAPGVVCVTGLVLPWQLETREQLWFEEYGGFAKGFTRRVFDLADHRGDHVLYPYLPGQYGTGANIAFQTRFLRELGGFDTELGGRNPVVGGEDIDILLQTVLHGGTLVYEPQALLWYQPYRTYAGLQRQMVIYGRGLSAAILKAALADRKVAWDIARRLPAGFRFLLDPRSSKNAGKQDFPRDLTRKELLGVASGPFAYLWARMSRRRQSRRAALPEDSAQPI